MTQLDITKAAQDYRDIQSMIKELENEAEGIKARLTAHMDAQGADTIQAGSFTVRWTSYNSQRVDTTSLKKELPEVAARYTKVTEARRFQIQ
jgi:predicted phage-related endonuclease